MARVSITLSISISVLCYVCTTSSFFMDCLKVIIRSHNQEQPNRNTVGKKRGKKSTFTSLPPIQTSHTYTYFPTDSAPRQCCVLEIEMTPNVKCQKLPTNHTHIICGKEQKERGKEEKKPFKIVVRIECST